jgi:hypothetical protein
VGIAEPGGKAIIIPGKNGKEKTLTIEREG